MSQHTNSFIESTLSTYYLFDEEFDIDERSRKPTVLVVRPQ